MVVLCSGFLPEASFFRYGRNKSSSFQGVLTLLAVTRKVSASTQNQALNTFEISIEEYLVFTAEEFMSLVSSLSEGW